MVLLICENTLVEGNQDTKFTFHYGSINLHLVIKKRSREHYEFNEVDAIIEKYTDKERIVKLHKERKAFEDQVEELGRNVIISEEEARKEEKKCFEFKELLDKELDKDKQQSSMIKEKDIAERATKIVESLIAEIKNGVRDKISSTMNKMFFKFNWKKETFKDVKLSSSYMISLINVDGFECLGTCSAAERELLALSFTLALHKESGFDGPLVIDTPISRISGILRTNFAKVFREISEDKQIILYLTEDEYSEQVRDIFGPCASSKYKLTLKDENFVEKRCL